jgi:hypothetical protein
MTIRDIHICIVLLLLWFCPARATVFYVNVNIINPTPPYTNWPTAATNIQDAVDASASGDFILVTNGVFNAGGRNAPDGSPTCVVVTHPLTLESVNGATGTLIDGGNEVRCIYLADGAILSGFTVTNGNSGTYHSGGGIACASINAWVVNSLIISNHAGMQGGGISFGTASNCMISCNRSGQNWGGGGASSGVLIQCTLSNNSSSYLGGAAYSAILSNCIVVGNWAGYNGGGAYLSTLYSCLVISNLANGSGGGADDCSLNNCTITANSSYLGGGVSSSGGGPSIACNCIVCYNFATNSGADIASSFITNCCSLSNYVANGSGNITNAPQFVNQSAGDFHLQPNSRCINAGKNIYAADATELDGNPRVRGGTVDIGAYEFQAQVTGTFTAFLQQYGLPIDGSADYVDSDGDGMNNWQEWIAGTNPTNSTSLLRLLPTLATNNSAMPYVNWQSVNNRTYYLQRATDLTTQPAFSAIQSNLVGQAGTTSFTDTTATNSGPYFYRVGIQ